MFPAEGNPRVDRVRFELRATGVKPEQGNPLLSGVHARGYLPHVKREGMRYFVTFRLADSLPREVLLKLQSERAQRRQQFYAQQQVAQKSGTPAMQTRTEILEQIERDYHRQVERYLDRGAGECLLRRPEIADLVSSSIRFFDGQRYVLKAWVVMPNHVHLVLWPMPNRSLSRIVQSLKRNTAREANKLLNRTGKTFWQPEPFDHWIRNDEEHERCCRYVLWNPVKAGLCPMPESWKWSSAWQAPRPSKET